MENGISIIAWNACCMLYGATSHTINHGPSASYKKNIAQVSQQGHQGLENTKEDIGPSY